MELYFTSSLRVLAALLAGKTLIAVLSLSLFIVVSGCEQSPEQVKFRDPPKSYDTPAVMCQEGDCPDSAGSTGKAGPPRH